MQQQKFLTPTEEAYLNKTKEFTNAQQRYIRCRLKKKLRLLSEQVNSCNVAADERAGCDSWSSLVSDTDLTTMINETEKKKWAECDLNARPPPCQGGILTRLDHRPYIYTAKNLLPQIYVIDPLSRGNALFSLVPQG